MTYKIYKKHHHNKHGKIDNTKFFIKKKKKGFLGRTYWKTITHTECGYGDCWKEPTTFRSEEEAVEFIQTVLCPETPRQEWIETPIKEISCDQ